MMTIKGFPFNVDHDTNYVTYAGNLGGVPQNWHVEYCKGENQPKSPKDMSYKANWSCNHYYFPGAVPVTAGDIAYPAKANLTNTPASLSWSSDDACYAGDAYPDGFQQTKQSKSYIIKRRIST